VQTLIPELLTLMTLAAELRAGGNSWDVVVANVQRSPRITCDSRSRKLSAAELRKSCHQGAERNPRKRVGVSDDAR
jgi:hypothetical protein